MKGRYSFGRSSAWSTKDQSKVTCKQCLNLLAKMPMPLPKVEEPYDRDGYTAGSDGW